MRRSSVITVSITSEILLCLNVKQKDFVLANYIKAPLTSTKKPDFKWIESGFFIVTLDALTNRTSLSTFLVCLVLDLSDSELFGEIGRLSKAGYHQDIPSYNQLYILYVPYHPPFYATSTNFFFILCTVLMPAPPFFAIIRIGYPFRSCLMTPAYSSCNFSSDFL